MTWVLFLELLAKSGAIAGAGLGLSALLRFRSASDRATVLRAAVCLLIALPLFLVIGPNLPLAWLSPTEAPAVVAAPGASWSVDLQPVADATLNGALPAGPPWALIVALVYSAGLLLVAGRFVVGVWTLGRWTGDGRPVTHRLWTEALRRLDASGRTRLIASPRIDAPLSWGLPPGVVLISEDCLKRPETAPAVLAHELAHIRRGDWLFMLLSRLAVALFWFNPLVWALHATLSARTEEAADAAAVDQVDRQTYARALVDLASDFKAPAALASLGMGGSSKSLTRRIARIMKTQRRLPSRPLTLALSIGALAAVATPLAAVELTARAPRPAQEPATPRTSNLASSVAPNMVLTPTSVTWTSEPPKALKIGHAFYRVEGDAETRRASEQARIEAEQARTQADQDRVEAEHARTQADQARIQAQVARQDAMRAHRENASLARTQGRVEAAAARAQAQAAVAQTQARKAMAQARVDMRNGADQMDKGAEQMCTEAEKLRDPAYRAQVIADNRARGNRVTDAELIALSRSLPEQAADMTRQAQRMREQAARDL